MTQILLFAAIAGICGTGVGALLCVLLLKQPSEKVICRLLSFAAGVMVSIVFFGLVPETLKFVDEIICLFGLVLGILIIVILNYIVDKITSAKNKNGRRTSGRLHHVNQFANESARMFRSGILMLIAISLHNIPEGVAIGAGGSHNRQLGVILAVMIALHNIPEGMAIAAPLMASGIKKWKVVFWTALAGSMTLLGGIIGAAFGAVSDLAIALSLSAAGGAMLYIVFGEIMTQYVFVVKSRKALIITLLGVIAGLAVTRI